MQGLGYKEILAYLEGEISAGRSSAHSENATPDILRSGSLPGSEESLM